MVLVLIALGLAVIVLAGLNLVLDEQVRARPQALFQHVRRRLRPLRAALDRR